MSAPGLLDASAIEATGRAIARTQYPSGAIPWYANGPVDPWDHVEAAMGLTLAGERAAVTRAYEWLIATQRPDGSWPSRRVRGRITDATGDANFAAYISVGLWLDVLVTGRGGLARRAWPTVARAVDFVLGLQDTTGAVWWARDPSGRVFPQALITASCGVLLSLRCASALAERLGHPRPDWELAATRLAGALQCDAGVFFSGGRHAMDWYWPVLAGAVSDPVARLEDGWGRYVVPGLGVRCVADRPWVTAAESAELVMALATCGRLDAAAAVFESVQHLRADDGAYWTGYVWPDRARWPVERTTWTAGAVLMADNALPPDSPVRRLLATRADLLTDVAVPAASR